MPKSRKLFSLLLTIALVVSLVPATPISAQIDNCSAAVNLPQVGSGVTTDFSITVTNGSAQRIRWLKITRPSGNFTLSSITAPLGWVVVASDSTSITINGHTVNTGASRTFTLNNVVVANVNAPAANWTVEASHDNSGTAPYACTGTLGTQIGTPDSTPPVIANIAVSNITTSSASVSWTTNEPATSRVNYGLTSGYGSNISSGTLTTSHSLNLSGLSANTGYHFQVQSTDASNNTATSSDNTFLTSVASSSSGPTTPAASASPTQSVPSGDTVLPTVTVGTNLTAVYTEAPTIVGTASDNSAVISVEYSTDGGENWLPVDKATGLGSPQVSFEFKPLGLPDGNYDLLVRATDSSNNQGLSPAAVLIIDRLPPLIGPNMVSFGSQIATVENKTIFAVMGVDQRVTLATLGGPSSLVVTASTLDETETKTFTFTETSVNGFWSGILAFEKPGEYKLTAAAVDGANNRVARELNNVLVQAPSVVLDQALQGIAGAEVTVNYYDAESSSWYVWDAAAFGQQNPQTTNEDGEFNFFLPAGKYYLQVYKSGYYRENSQIFEKSVASPLATSAILEQEIGFSLGSLKLTLPRVTFESFTINDPDFGGAAEDPLVGKTLPEFSLSDTDNHTVKSLDLTGKATLITFLATWSPTAEEQITQLQKLAQSQGQNIFVITSLESSAKTKVYQKLGNYSLEFLSDSDGAVLAKFDTLTVPEHIFVARDLTIKQTKSGVLTSQELQEELSKL